MKAVKARKRKTDVLNSGRPVALFDNDARKTENTQYGIVLRYECPECKSPLVRINSKHAACPNGHGKLTAAFPWRDQKRFFDDRWKASLPTAKRLGTTTTFEIAGHTGKFRVLWRGVCRTSRDTKDIVIAKIATVKGREMAMGFKRLDS